MNHYHGQLKVRLLTDTCCFLMKLQGIDSDEPILQLGRNVFSGEYKDTLGTKVLFECNSSMCLSGFLNTTIFSVMFYHHNYFMLSRVSKNFLQDVCTFCPLVYSVKALKGCLIIYNSLLSVESDFNSVILDGHAPDKPRFVCHII